MNAPHKITVDISSKFPVFIAADADAFGAVFAAMADDDQIHVFRAMVEAMKAHPTQWDHISIALERPENSDVRDTLRNVLFPAEETACCMGLAPEIECPCARENAKAVQS